MPAPMTPNELLDWLVRNQLLSGNRVAPFPSPPAQYADSRVLANDLNQRQLLTPFQLNQILQGKGDDLLLGQYRLIERIGEGAMGQVYKGFDIRDEEHVAVKMIRKEHLPKQKAMDR